MKAALLLLLALAAQGALAHSYYRADLAGPDTNATGSLEFFTHHGAAYYTLNVTDIEEFSNAALVFGNASSSSEPVVMYVDFGNDLQAGTFSWNGLFTPDNFTAEYPWTLNGMQANIGLDHVWAVVNNNASYGSIMLLGKVNKIPYEEIKSQYIIDDPSGDH